MITLVIGGAQRDLSSQADLEESWINQQINRRRADGKGVCVTIRVQQDTIDLILATPGCASGGGGTRPPRPEEERVFALWRERGLDHSDFTGGQLIGFLRQMFPMIGL